VAELVDALDSKSSSARSAGSIPARGTKLKTSIITIAYIISSIPDFHKYLRDALKIHVKISLQPSVLLAFLLVSREQTFTANFAIPNEGIEQMTRKNDGACANPKQPSRFQLADCRVMQAEISDRLASALLGPVDKPSAKTARQSSKSIGDETDDTAAA
jgi:hypothetical protein